MLLRNVIILTFGFQIMLNITRPLIPLYASELGAGTFDIGMLTAAYAFFPLLLAIHIGKISDHVGDRLPAIVGTICLTAGIALPYLFHTIWSLYCSQAIVGVSQILINVSMQNVLGHAATKQTRDRYFSYLSMSVALGGVVGPVAGGYLAEHISYPFAFLIAVAFGIIPIALSFAVPVVRATAPRKDEEAPGSGAEGSTLSLLKIPLLRKALASSALVLYSRDIFVAYFPLYAALHGLSASLIGWIITVQGITMVLVRLFLPKLTELLGRHQILLVSILTAGISFALIPLLPYAWAYFALAGLMGAGLGCGQPLSMTTTYNASPKTRTGEVLGLRLASNRLSQMIAPLFFGLLGQATGLVSVFYISGLFLAGGAMITRTREEPEQAGH